MITRGLVWRLGLSQLVCWGISYYAIALFAGPIAAETGWSLPVVVGGFSGALLVSGTSSPWVGRLMDRRGGRLVMSVGSGLIALGCAALALSDSVATYYLAWGVMGLAMRMTLYDAAFAALARIGGPEARRPISQITLLGGLASTIVWPIGGALIVAFGWRTALLAYAGLALLTVPLHLAIPDARYRATSRAGTREVAHLATTSREVILASWLFATGVTLTTVLNSAMSAQMITILGGLGFGAGLAVWTATLRGIGQSAARLGEVLFGRRLNPLALGVAASAVLPLAFAVGLLAGGSPFAGMAFALLYGAGNGLLTIVRGTQPLVLFDPDAYGTIVGRLIAPGFYLSALSPVACAYLIERLGAASALGVALGLATVVFGVALALWRSFRPGSRPVQA